METGATAGYGGGVEADDGKRDDLPRRPEGGGGDDPAARESGSGGNGDRRRQEPAVHAARVVWWKRGHEHRRGPPVPLVALRQDLKDLKKAPDQLANLLQRQRLEKPLLVLRVRTIEYCMCCCEIKNQRSTALIETIRSLQGLQRRYIGNGTIQGPPLRSAHTGLVSRHEPQRINPRCVWRLTRSESSHPPGILSLQCEVFADFFFTLSSVLRALRQDDTSSRGFWTIDGFA